MRRLLFVLGLVLLSAGSARAQNCVTINGASVCTASTATAPTMAVRQRGAGYAFCVQSAITGANLWCIDKTGVSSSTVASIFGADAIATTSTDGLVVRNATLASAGVTVQMSPRLRWQGAAWNSTSGLSETDSFFAENLPATVAGTTTATWKLGVVINGGAATYPMTVSNAGTLSSPVAGWQLDPTAMFVPAGALMYWTTRAVMASPADGHWNISTNGQSIGSRLKVDALPTVSSGFGTSPAITAGSTPFAGSVNVGTGGVATSGIINFNGATAFPSAPFCVANDATTTLAQRASASTTQLTITSAAWTASDIVTWICVSAK